MRAAATDGFDANKSTNNNTNLFWRERTSPRGNKNSCSLRRGGFNAHGEIRVHSCCYSDQSVRGRGAGTLTPLF
jgi:hypothetical protein